MSQEVEQDKWRVEIIRLKSKLRQVTADKGISDVYDCFEEDLKR